MRLTTGVLTLLLPVAGLLPAQTWEVGGSAGYGLYHDVSVTGPSAAGKAGFAPGLAFGGLLGNNISRLVGGEIRYTFRVDDLHVSSSGQKALAGGQSHALHYDVLIHATGKEAAVRPFLAVGAGAKLYRGTGAEPVFQPLSNLVVLTHTRQSEALISVGGGVKIAASRRTLVRLDFRDYATPRPDELLALPPNVKSSGWMHDFVFLVGIGTTF